jgi:DNA-binding transcriptional ArsR family regulator
MGLAMATTQLLHPPATSLELAAVLHALSDPVRLNIVCTLDAEGERTCGTFEVAVSKSTLSHHFRVLREAGVTLTEPRGTQRVVSLRRDDLDARFPGLLDTVLAAAAR